MSDAKPVDALVVGAGLAGLYQLHLLRGRVFRTRVVEAGDGVGGTWFWNRYPGARCDVESHFYSYSFDPDPTSHPVGTKRPLLDSGYYATFNEEHVHLVDLRSTPLLEITERGIRTTEAEYAFDAIVLATGFDAMTGALLAVDITGAGEQTLRDAWAEGPNAYLGIGVAGFPNLFTITGPTSPSVLSNMIVSIEQHVEWVADCIAHLRDEGIAAIEPTPEAQETWARHAEEVGNATLYPTADSWYMGANVPGKPRVFMPYIGGVGAYRERCDEVVANGYEGFTLVPAGARYAAAPTKEESS